MDPETGLTHFDAAGQAIMVDVSGKQDTCRVATASGVIAVNRAVYDAIEQGTARKGDVLGVARIAGIMGIKATSATIPLCHPLPIAKCSSSPHHLRHVQGHRQAHGNPLYPPRPQERRQER